MAFHEFAFCKARALHCLSQAEVWRLDFPKPVWTVAANSMGGILLGISVIFLTIDISRNSM